jgi:hypothetical protein
MYEYFISRIKNILDNGKMAIGHWCIKYFCLLHFFLYILSILILKTWKDFREHGKKDGKLLQGQNRLEMSEIDYET